MRVLFVHQNFPAQFKHLAPVLAREGYDVKAIKAGPTNGTHWQGIHTVGWQANRSTTQNAHPFSQDYETKLIRAEAAARIAEKLRAGGWIPDLIIGHPGWGEMLFLDTVWPESQQLHYLEFHYSPRGLDVGFDSEFGNLSWESQSRVVAKTASSLIGLNRMDHGITPTRFQASTYPEWARERISVVHDGIDTNVLRPDKHAVFKPSADSPTFRVGDPVLTFVSRNLEPYRGYHRIMRALPEIQSRNPEVHTVLVGGDNVSYGSAAPEGKTWKQVFLDEVADRIDRKRVWFTGRIGYPEYIRMLQVSRCHVYFTYPFVLGWSCLEAMAIGCSVVGSNTEPVREVIENHESGILVDFFDQDELVGRVTEILRCKEESERIGNCARKRVIDCFDLNGVCLPRQLRLIRRLIG